MAITGGDVTVVIPTLPERAEQLERALASVAAQTVKPGDVVVEVDHRRAGAHVARNAALAKVTTSWVAFLDDDDLFHPDHLEVLIDGANTSGADLVSSYPEADQAGSQDSLYCCYKGQVCQPPLDVPWGPEQIEHLDTRRGEMCPHCGGRRGSFIMNTNLVRMDLVRKIGGVPAPGSMGKHFAGHGAEDYLFLLALLDAGARFHHVTGVRTWTYHVKTRPRPTHPLAIARAAIGEYGAIQKEGELAGFLAVLMDLDPRVVVEIGSASGGTLYAWQQLPTVRRVVAIDMPGGPYGDGDYQMNDHGCEVIYGDSHDPATLHHLEDVLGTDPLDVLFIDGDHSYDGVKADWEMYSPLVRSGGVVGFHDICNHDGVQIYWDGKPASVDVDMFWRQLQLADPSGDEIITTPRHWGGIGWRTIRRDDAG